MSRPFSIGIVCFPSLGGSGVVASDLALGLAERGHRVHLVARSRPTRTLPSCERLTFHEVHVPDYPVFEHAPYALALASKLVEVAQRQRLDLLQVHYAVPHAVSAHLVKEMQRASAPRVVVSLHGTDVTHLGADPAYRPVTAFAVERADGVTVPSDFLRREAMERLALSPETEIEVLPNFVDTERFSPPGRRDRAVLDAVFRSAGKPVDDGPVLFHVSNFRAVKRVGDLLRVVARVARKLPIRLVLVGDGPERGQAERLASELGISQRVCFLGRQHEFAEFLRHSDAFLLTSQVESFGIAGLEALAAGVPVLGYAVGGVPEVVVEGTGKLVEPFDVEALASAVLDFFADSEKADAMRIAAREHALARFRRGPALERFEKYFQRILDSGRSDDVGGGRGRPLHEGEAHIGDEIRGSEQEMGTTVRILSASGAVRNDAADSGRDAVGTVGKSFGNGDIPTAVGGAVASDIGVEDGTGDDSGQRAGSGRGAVARGRQEGGRLRKDRVEG